MAYAAALNFQSIHLMRIVLMLKSRS